MISSLVNKNLFGKNFKHHCYSHSFLQLQVLIIEIGNFIKLIHFLFM